MPTTFQPKVAVCEGLDDMTSKARQCILDIIAAKPADKQVSLALSGGSTPKKLYESLHANDLALLRDQQRVLFIFGDDRLYPLEHEQSNYHMAKKALLRDVPEACQLLIDPTAAVATSENVEGGEAGARAVASAYEAALLNRLETTEAPVPAAGNTVKVPVVDIVLLGFGSDGHTASVFPDSIAAADTTAAVSVAFPSPTMSPKVWRVTLTPAAICSARHVIVLAAGKDKQWVIDGILNPNQPEAAGSPVARFLRHCKGEVHFILDKDSAAGQQTAAL